MRRFPPLLITPDDRADTESTKRYIFLEQNTALALSLSLHSSSSSSSQVLRALATELAQHRREFVKVLPVRWA